MPTWAFHTGSLDSYISLHPGHSAHGYLKPTSNLSGSQVNFTVFHSNLLYPWLSSLRGRNGWPNSIISLLQMQSLEAALPLSFPHLPRAICQEVLCTVFSKYIQDPILTTSLASHLCQSHRHFSLSCCHCHLLGLPTLRLAFPSFAALHRAAGMILLDCRSNNDSKTALNSPTDSHFH